MSRLRDFHLIIECRLAGQTPPETHLVWEAETEAFDRIAQRIAAASQFEGLEKKRGNWFCIFQCGKSRYRWQMPDEDTAKRVEQYAQNGGGMAYARRKAIRSYKFDDAAGRWQLLNIKNSKKWAEQRSKRTRVKRKKARQKRQRQKAIEQSQEWAQRFDERMNGGTP